MTFGLKKIFGLEALRGQLRFYAIVLVALPLCLTPLFFFLFQRGQVIDASMYRLVSNLTKESEILCLWIDERFEDLRFLANMRAVTDYDVSTMTHIFQSYKDTHRHVTDIIFVDADGRMGAALADVRGTFVGDREYFMTARAGRSSLVFLPAGRVSGKPICLFISPVFRQPGVFGGLLAISVELKNLNIFLTDTMAPPGGAVLLSDAKGRILAPAAAVAAGGGPGQARVPSALLRAGASGDCFKDEAGREWLGAAVPLGNFGWTLLGQAPVDVVLASYRHQTLWLSLAVLATLAITLPFVLRLSRDLERPLESLADFARDLRASHYRASCPPRLPKASPRELRELHTAFCEMANEVRAHIDEAERLGVLDALTGLYNRRFLFSSGVKLLESAARAGRTCSCLMLDVDHFKVVNDTYGHSTGDQVLVHLARIMAACVREGDIVSRYGGEEFAILATGADATHAAELAERVRLAIEAHPTRVGPLELPVTVSIGVADARELIEYGESVLDDMLARADKALYAAKAAGRNRVVITVES